MKHVNPSIVEVGNRDNKTNRDTLKTTQNIGRLSNKVMVFGGIYSNYQALSTLISIAEREKIEPSNIICTGDIVGYCAEPERCLQAVKDWGIHTILGNVEIQLRDDAPDCGCNFDNDSRCDVLSKQWYPFAQNHVSKSSRSWLASLPEHLTFKFGNKKWLVVHGSFFDTSAFIFRSTPWEIKKENLKAARVDGILAGHCGLPFHDVEASHYWLNAGVIGMPANDGTTRVWYMILEENPFRFEHRSFEYDFRTAYDLMTANALPSAYAETLLTGIWDNCDILPDEETEAQGCALSL